MSNVKNFPTVRLLIETIADYESKGMNCEHLQVKLRNIIADWKKEIDKFFEEHHDNP